MEHFWTFQCMEATNLCAMRMLDISHLVNAQLAGEIDLEQSSPI